MSNHSNVNIVDAGATEQLKTVLSCIAENCEVTLDFKKKNGENRTIRFTLNPSVIPKQELKESSRKPNPEVMSVWDLDKEAWRSFRIDSVIKVKDFKHN